MEFVPERSEDGRQRQPIGLSSTEGPNGRAPGGEPGAQRLGGGADVPIRARIFLAEDEQIVALELKERLTLMGHQVAGIAASGEEAIDEVRRLRPDLVLMDIKLQGDVDGIEAAAAIRRDTGIPVIYLTAFADDATLQRAKLTEPYGYILKPFQERELHGVIEVSLYRSRVERALRESEAWRLALLRSVGDAVVATGPDGRVKFMNALAEALTGWKELDAIGKPLDEVFKTVERLERHGGVWKDVTSRVLIGRDGSEHPINGEFTPIRDANNVPAGSVCIFRDISAQKLLQDRQQLMALVSGEVSSSLDRGMIMSKVTSLIAENCAGWCVIHLKDAQGTLQAAALAHWEGARNASAAQWKGNAVRDEDAIEVARVVRTGSSVLEPDATPDGWATRALGIPPELGLVAASAIIVPLQARGQCLGTLTLVSQRRGRPFNEPDVTFAEELGRRVAHGIDNSHLYADSQRATRMRDEVLAIVSHDLRNPLSSITMNAEQLLRTPEKADQQRVLKNAAAIRRNADRMNQLIDDLLDVGRIDSGQLSVELRRNRTTGLVSEVFAAFEALASERSIRLVSTDLPDLDLLCDQRRVIQVLSNLIGNALKFSPEGRRIAVSGEVRGDMFMFSVSDTAGGIAPAQIDHIFEKYWQAPEVRTKGSGLGLYISKGIIEAHGGHIWVDSTHGEGSTFYFTIPLASRTAEQLPAL
jgi:PAS domain S-box-containing protein